MGNPKSTFFFQKSPNFWFRISVRSLQHLREDGVFLPASLSMHVSIDNNNNKPIEHQQ